MNWLRKWEFKQKILQILWCYIHVMIQLESILDYTGPTFMWFQVNLRGGGNQGVVLKQWGIKHY